VDGYGTDSSDGSDGWYAGDCLDPSSFSSTYGYVDFDCGDNCQVNYSDKGSSGTGGSTSSGSGSSDDDSCYDDDYPCLAAITECAGDSTCESDVEDCYDTSYPDDDTDATQVAAYNACLVAAACTADDSTCSTDITTATAASTGRRLKATAMDSYPYNSGVVIYGEDTIDTDYPTYCDHYHLYSFYFDTITPQGSSDSELDLDVHGWTMIGFPGMCTYTEWAAIDYPLIEGVDVATTGDQFAMTCGYYVQYEWSGYDDVYFEITSMNAVGSAVTAFALVAVSSLLL